MPYLQSGKKDGTRFGMTCRARRHGHTGTGLTQRTSAVYAICWCESNASSYSRRGPRTYIVKPKRLCRHSVKLRKLQRRTWPTDSQSGCQSAETSSSSLAVIESRTHTSVKVKDLIVKAKDCNDCQKWPRGQGHVLEDSIMILLILKANDDQDPVT